MEIGFGDFHSRSVAYHVGTPVKLTGKTVEKAGRTILNKITRLESLFGNSTPGKARVRSFPCLEIKQSVA